MDQSAQIQNLLEQAVYQQLFLGDKRIMGKNPENSMQLTGVSDLLNEFIEELRNNLHLISEGKIDQFINFFEKKFKIPLNKTKTKISNNLNEMNVNEDQNIIVTYMTLTKMIEALREFAYKNWGEKKIIKKFENQTGKKFDKKISEKVQTLAAINDRSISLLYNLSFISLLTTCYHSKKFATTVKRLTTGKVNEVIKKLI